MHTKNPYSLLTIMAVLLALILATFVYYPKWKAEHREKVISWDVAGYYQYLPAIFIYKDLKKANYLEDVLKKYRFTPNNQQTLPLPNGNRVMKYAAGQAVQYSPFFLLAHAYAKGSDIYPADGFSTPYQFAMEIGIIFYALIGLWFLRKILLRYFSDAIASITIIGIALGTNYFEYASMNGAMTHNNLFALYALLIYTTIRFHEKQTWWSAIVIGCCIGLAMLTRPTEIVSVLIPLLWPIASMSALDWRGRLAYFRTHASKIATAIIVTICIGSVQLIYWKYVSGDWLVYSYGKEGFDWLSPHIRDCLISMRAGWLVYSPMIGFALIGFYSLYKKDKTLFLPCVTASLLAMYIVFSWQTWWYGGSVGQRAMIQYYPILAFPFAAFFEQVGSHRLIKKIVYPLFIVFIYHNIWVTHQVHWGGLIYVGQMNTPYMTKILWKYDVPESYKKLLDSNEYFNAHIVKSNTVLDEKFENKQAHECSLPPIQGYKSECLGPQRRHTPEWTLSEVEKDGQWIHASADFYTQHRVWSKWDMGMMILKFYDKNKIVKENRVRIHRLLRPNQTKNISLEARLPEVAFDKVTFQILNGAQNNKFLIDNVKVNQIWAN